jgi:hypothetical protein
LDSIRCSVHQKEKTKKIREKGADYVLAVKENQKGLHEDIKDYFEGMERRETEELPDDILVTVKICQQIPQYGLVFTYFSHTKWQMLSYLI